jgi:hypothetical protein
MKLLMQLLPCTLQLQLLPALNSRVGVGVENPVPANRSFIIVSLVCTVAGKAWLLHRVPQLPPDHFLLIDLVFLLLQASAYAPGPCLLSHLLSVDHVSILGLLGAGNTQKEDPQQHSSKTATG